MLSICAQRCAQRCARPKLRKLKIVDMKYHSVGEGATANAENATFRLSPLNEQYSAVVAARWSNAPIKSSDDVAMNQSND